MTTFSTQFHATPEELYSFVKRWVTTHNLYIIATTFPPYHARQVTVLDLAEAMTRKDALQLLFTLTPPVVVADDQGRVHDENPQHLVLHLGKLTEKGLGESCLNTMNAAPAFQQINRDLKRHTKAGAMGRNPKTGDEGFSRNHRYTEGVRQLSKQGVVIRSLTGSAEYTFPD